MGPIDHQKNEDYKDWKCKCGTQLKLCNGYVYCPTCLDERLEPHTPKDYAKRIGLN